MFKALQEKRKKQQENEITLLTIIIAFIGMTVNF
jgi:hypothetical protein